MALEGRICLCLRPPKEFHPEKFVNDPDVSTIKNILAFDKVSEDTDENISNQEVSEEDQSSKLMGMVHLLLLKLDYGEKPWSQFTVVIGSGF